MIVKNPAGDTQGVWRQRVPGPQFPGVVSGVTFLTGLWLVLAPSIWDYGGTPGALAARWNDVIVGLLLTTIGYLRLRRAAHLTPVTATGVALGTWLLIAPFAMGYDEATGPTLQDISAGLLIISLTMTGHLVATGGVTGGVTGAEERQRNGGRR